MTVTSGTDYTLTGPHNAAVRKVRHWRQKFDSTPGTRYVFTRAMLFDGKQYRTGDLVPEGVRRHLLRNMFDSRRIALAPGELEIDPQDARYLKRADKSADPFAEGGVPTEEVKEPEQPAPIGEPPVEVAEQPQSDMVAHEVKAVHEGAGWYNVTNKIGETYRVRGKEARDELLEQFRNEGGA